MNDAGPVVLLCAMTRTVPLVLVPAEAAREPVLNDELDDYRWIVPDALAGLGELKLTGGLEDVIRSAHKLIEL